MGSRFTSIRPSLHPRTWEAQFQSGIKTIALIAVKEGVIQLGSVEKVIEDLSFVVQLRKKFNYIESIPGVLLPHPLSSSIPSLNVDTPATSAYDIPDFGRFQSTGFSPPMDQIFYNNFSTHQLRVTPSMSSLENLLAKLPSVVPPPPETRSDISAQKTLELLAMEKVAKVEINDEDEVVFTQLVRRYHDNCDISSCHNHGF